MPHPKSRREIALDYLVSVVQSDQADPARRDAAARLLLDGGAALPAKAPGKAPKAAKAPAAPKPPAPGKKEQQLADAETAGTGTPWENRL